MSTGNWSEDDNFTVGHYSRLLGEHGVDVRSLDWGSAESQQQRFLVLSQIDPQLADRTVLDVGCGLGDFYVWLTRRGPGCRRYLGIDITPGMIDTAKQRFPGIQFSVGSSLEIDRLGKECIDYVFASGIFCLRKVEPFEFMKKTIRNMFMVCGRGVAFNSLSSWAPHKDAGEFYADPLETLEFCRTITPWVTLRHDYHPRDFTIYMFKKQNA